MVFIGAVRAVTLQAAKARVPSIKFRKGGSPSPTSSSTVTSNQSSSAGRASATVILQELPARFQRQPLSQEEIDYINRGGPA